MRTPRNVDEPQLTRLLVERGMFRRDPVHIVDVGASGGIDSYWHEFGDQLRAVGFDPLIVEIERLKNEGARGVNYIAAWVTCASPLPDDSRLSTDFFQRTSAVRAAELARLDYTREHFNAGAELRLSDERIVLDDYFSDADASSIDFMKVDTDGQDYEVLVGTRSILHAGRVLGLAVEVQFQGHVSESANVFGNIDRLLRGAGFSLFDVEAYRYSRAALPAEFVYEIPAQTKSGQVSWGDALYFRDLGDPDYEQRWGFFPTSEDVLKLACFYELFGLLDCAAELILKYTALLRGELDCRELLDILATEQTGRKTSHAALIREFELDVRERFVPSRLASR